MQQINQHIDLSEKRDWLIGMLSSLLDDDNLYDYDNYYYYFDDNKK